MAHPKHQAIRQRFQYRRGYCGVSEEDAGGELTVDHYCPVAAGGDDSDENLVYACSRCNLYKRDFWPDAQDRVSGHRVLHPRQDDLSAHLRENADGTLAGLTETGSFHIAVLELNRAPLVAHRRRKRLTERQDIRSRAFMAIIEIQVQAMAAMALYIADLHEQGIRPFEDEENH